MDVHIFRSDKQSLLSIGGPHFTKLNATEKQASAGLRVNLQPVNAPEEFGYEGVRWVAIKIFSAADLHDTPSLHDG